MDDKLISAYDADEALSKLHGMYHIEDIRALISKLPSVKPKTPCWISTKDKLPENNLGVLAIIKSNNLGGYFYNAIVIAEYSPEFNEWELSDYDTEGREFTVSFWCEFPDIPEEIKEDNAKMFGEIFNPRIAAVANTNGEVWRNEQK